MKTLGLTPVESIIFDLDGTLWDTCQSCAIGWNNIINRHKINFRQIVADDVRGVAGKPHDECIRTVFRDLSEPQLQVLINETMVEDNRMVDQHGGELYPFVKDGIGLLREKYRLFIVSNCQSGYIETFLNYTNLHSAIDDFECFGDTRKSKSANIKLLMARNFIESAVYIGDTVGDQIAAKEAETPFAFVSYGFGKCQGHSMEFQSFSELTKHFCEKN